MIAGGGVRAVLELAGIRDILAKSLGTTNPINMLKATVQGLQSLRRPDEVAATRGLTISQVLPVSGEAAPTRRRPRRPQAAHQPQRNRRRRRRMAKLKITQTRSAIGQRAAATAARCGRSGWARSASSVEQDGEPAARRYAQEGPSPREGGLRCLTT